jgi:hypothetical protein
MTLSKDPSDVRVWHKADIPTRSINVRFWGFPATPLKLQDYSAISPPDLRSALQRGRKGQWMRDFSAAPTPPARPARRMGKAREHVRF